VQYYISARTGATLFFFNSVSPSERRTKKGRGRKRVDNVINLETEMDQYVSQEVQHHFNWKISWKEMNWETAGKTQLLKEM
jgi:hypothetical protein